jgi:hypothetical protein
MVYWELRMKANIVTIFPTPSERYLPAPASLDEARGSVTAEGPKLVNGRIESWPSIESVILQKLLTEVEARQGARAQPTYVIEQSPPRHRVILRVLWSTCWVLSITITALVVNSMDSRSIVTNRGGDHEDRSMADLSTNLARESDQFMRVSNALEQLASAIASSEQGVMAGREVMQPHVERSGQGNADVMKKTPVEAKPATAALLGNSKPETDSGPIPMRGHIHPPMEWGVAPANVVVHHNSTGVMDYWVMPRLVNGRTVMTKVVPVLQNEAGIFVHQIAEGRDYIVTSSGEWIPDATDGNGKK